jgi:hypothetical protein
MTYLEAVTLLRAHFYKEWNERHSDIAIQPPNGKLLNAEKVELDPKIVTWVRLSFLSDGAERIVVGGQLRRGGGHVVVNTFVPLGSGDGRQLNLDREIEQIWEQAHDNGLDGAIHLGAPEPIPGIRDPEIPSWRAGVSISFTINHAPEVHL